MMLFKKKKKKKALCEISKGPISGRAQWFSVRSIIELKYILCAVLSPLAAAGTFFYTPHFSNCFSLIRLINVPVFFEDLIYSRSQKDSSISKSTNLLVCYRKYQFFHHLLLLGCVAQVCREP